jgi:ribosomal protein L32E
MTLKAMTLSAMRGFEPERRNCMAEMVKSKSTATRSSLTAMIPERTWRRGSGYHSKKNKATRRTDHRPPDGFDEQYPIRQESASDWINVGERNAAELLKSMKSGLPYLLRHQTSKRKSQEPHADYKDLTLTVPQNEMSARDLLRTIAQALPGWQATAFPSHMILYKEPRT